MKLAAVRDALDRAGLGAKKAVAVGVELQPWEELLRDVAFDGIAQISQEESQAQRGLQAVALARPTQEIANSCRLVSSRRERGVRGRFSGVSRPNRTRTGTPAYGCLQAI